MEADKQSDVYVWALLAQMVKARAGDVKREFQAMVSVLMGLRDYDAESALQLIQASLKLHQEHDIDALVALCRDALSDHQLLEAIGLLAFVARVDGDISAEEEEVFALICVGLGVVIINGKVEFSR